MTFMKDFFLLMEIPLMVLKHQPFDGMYWVVRHEMGCLEHPSQLPCLGDLSWKPVDLLVQCQCDSWHVRCAHSVIPEQYCFWPLCLIVLMIWIYTICAMCTMLKSLDGFDSNFLNMLSKQDLIKSYIEFIKKQKNWPKSVEILWGFSRNIVITFACTSTFEY